MTDFFTIQDCWSYYIFKELMKFGVSEACLTPGSRSTPLVIALSKLSGINTSTHFDERAMAYYALGIAKTSGKPVALITTSGTAVLNLMPAIAEAYHDNIPLVVVSADRPPHLHGVGSNQTITQENIFNAIVTAALNLPVPNESYGIDAISHAISVLMNQSIENQKPVHINCPFTKPLIENNERSFLHYIHTKTKKNFSDFYVDEKIYSMPTLTSDIVSSEINHSKRPVILLGKLPFLIAKELQLILESLSIPYYADASSHLRFVPSSIQLKCESFIDNRQFNPDLVICVGDKFSSIAILNFLKSVSCNYTQIHLYKNLYNPCLKEGQFFLDQNLSVFMKSLKELKKKEPWFLSKKNDTVSQDQELKIISVICESLKKNQLLFASNSSSIRWINQVCIETNCVQTIANRGVSGIDGILSTAIGAAQGAKEELVLIIGDLSFFYDFNALDLIRNLSRPIKIIILNNFGGKLFTKLPIQKHKRLFENYFLKSHSYTFKNIAQQFQINYSQIESKNVNRDDILAVLHSTQNEILELTFK